MNFRFDALLGMDALKRWSWCLDRDAGTAIASENFHEDQDISWIPLEFDFRPPTLHLDDGTEATLDTGGKLSYRIGPAPTNAVGESLDWGVVFGKFKSKLWVGSLGLGGWDIPLCFGSLPDDGLDHVQLWGKTRWVVGSDILRHVQVTLDFPRHRLGIHPLRSTRDLKRRMAVTHE